MRPIGVWTAVLTVLVFCAYLALGLSAYSVVADAHPAKQEITFTTNERQQP